jgi:hypothetical protein
MTGGEGTSWGGVWQSDFKILEKLIDVRAS